MVEVDLENYRERVWRHIEEDAQKLDSLIIAFKKSLKERNHRSSGEVIAKTIDPIVQIISRCRFLIIIDIMMEEAKKRLNET